MYLRFRNRVIVNQSEITSYPKASVFILRGGTDDCVPVALEDRFQL